MTATRRGRRATSRSVCSAALARVPVELHDERFTTAIARRTARAPRGAEKTERGLPRGRTPAGELARRRAAQLPRWRPRVVRRPLASEPQRCRQQRERRRADRSGEPVARARPGGADAAARPRRRGAHASGAGTVSRGAATAERAGAARGADRPRRRAGSRWRGRREVPEATTPMARGARGARRRWRLAPGRTRRWRDPSRAAGASSRGSLVSLFSPSTAPGTAASWSTPPAGRSVRRISSILGRGRCICRVLLPAARGAGRQALGPALAAAVHAPGGHELRRPAIAAPTAPPPPLKIVTVTIPGG